MHILTLATRSLDASLSMADKLFNVLSIQIKQKFNLSLIFSFKISEDEKFLGLMSHPLFLCRR